MKGFETESAIYVAIAFYELAMREHSQYDNRGVFEEEFGSEQVNDEIWEIVEYLRNPNLGIRTAKQMASRAVLNHLIRNGIEPNNNKWFRGK